MIGPGYPYPNDYPALSAPEPVLVGVAPDPAGTRFKLCPVLHGCGDLRRHDTPRVSVAFLREEGGRAGYGWPWRRQL